jgi:murein L,D-transpeptidase YcbB/YkuD
VLNPYWNIPASIINEELLPKLKKDPSYLEKNHMEVVSNKHLIDASKINWNKYVNNFPYEIRQKPGDDNAVGKIKFLFPNNFSIYIHDTPHKNLFNKKSRLYSDGCIRVENPVTLAEYILPSTTTFTATKIKQILDSNIETNIDIKPSFPVYITYCTAWVDTDGNLNFRNDIYNLDNELEKEIFSN